MKRPTAEVTKEVTFEAAHYLHNPKWDRLKNLEVFRKCAGYRKDNPKAIHFPHGHSYRLAVRVQGPVRDETGFVIDFRVLKEILHREVFARFDHRFINREVEPFKSNPQRQPTAENMAFIIWKLLEQPLKKEKVRLVEVALLGDPRQLGGFQGRERPLKR